MLVPDCSTAVLDPFAAQTALIIFCDVHEPLTGQPYARDPRSTAKKAERHLISTGIGDKAFFGPEAEFFIFDDVRYKAGMNGAMYQIDSEEGPYVSDKEFADGNSGHRPPIKGGYFPVPPVDGQSDLRAEMLSVMADMGLRWKSTITRWRPHRPSWAFSFRPWSTPPTTADLQIRGAQRRPAIRQDRDLYAQADHGRQRLGDACPPILVEGREHGVCRQPLCRSVGDRTLLHRRHHPPRQGDQRLHQPDHQQLQAPDPGFEAPVLLAYSSRNRSASCRIPYVSSPKAKRVEVRYPDGAANPYLAFAAMMMAGLDGIQNKIHPGDPIDKNLYDLPPEELKDVPVVCGSLREALGELAHDHAFLMKGEVFNKDQIEAYIELKWEEVYNFEHTPHPIEFQMYYSV